MTQHTNRAFARTLAREISADEIDAVAGAGGDAAEVAPGSSWTLTNCNPSRTMDCSDGSQVD